MTINQAIQFISIILLAGAATTVLGQGAPDDATMRPKATTTTSGRAARRPLLTEEQYAAMARDLREAYSKPADQWPAAEIDDAARPTFKELGLLPKPEFP